jgi:hypothetical protein
MNVFSDELSYCRPGTAAALDRYAPQCNDRAVKALEPFFAPHDDFAPALLCLRAMVGFMGVTLVPSASATYQRLFMAQGWTVVGQLRGTEGGTAYLDPPFMDLLRGSFGIVRYQAPMGKTDYPFIYFGFARALGVDVREEVTPKITWNWGFGQDQLFSETWQHARYLVAMNDQQASEAVLEKVRRQTEPNVVLSYLRDVAAMKSDRAKWIVTQFADDTRGTDNGITGVPFIPLGREVATMLANW